MGELKTRARSRHGQHLFAECPQLLCVYITPYTLHIVPVSYYAMLDRILDFEKTAKLLCAPTNEDVSFQGTCHNSDVFRSSDAVLLDRIRKTIHELGDDIQRWEEAFWVILASKACLDGP